MNTTLYFEYFALMTWEAPPLRTNTQPFGRKASVIIHKGGAAGVYKGRYQSLADFYDKQTVTFTDGAQIDYLKPTDK